MKISNICPLKKIFKPPLPLLGSAKNCFNRHHGTIRDTANLNTRTVDLLKKFKFLVRLALGMHLKNCK